MANCLRFCLLVVVFASIAALAVAQERRVYIVYLGGKPSDEFAAVNAHSSMLQQLLPNSLIRDYLIHSYKRSFNGFAARLTEEESRSIAGMEGVVSVFPSKTYHLHTSRSWDFLGLKETVERLPTVESNVIIGVLDTGIQPESESFNDEGFGPPPKKWKGICQSSKNFACNKKVIGARVYLRTGDTDPSDLEGHGTHTASTAAGISVNNASLYGLAAGTVRGAVPSARIAVYKVCSSRGCQDEDILAAFDDAIADGVDILSLSLGGEGQIGFDGDPIAIGAFHAMAKGILTTNSAGNSGPDRGTTSSLAPWLLSVAASSTDRRFVTKIRLGNGKTLPGISINTFVMIGSKFPLISGADASTECDRMAASLCFSGCLDPSRVKGKIIYCADMVDEQEARDGGAVGLIMQAPHPDISFTFSLPAAVVTEEVGRHILSYINNTAKPEAVVLKSEATLNSDAPLVGSFSSRGPNFIATDILKPDISGPGMEILAAWSPVAPLSSAPHDKRAPKYNIISGTSMACPHVTGAAAYVKTFHPDWSPAAIKSALMTTATKMNASKQEDLEFAYGAGNVNPLKAVQPGLVYDASKKDYLQFLCSLNYTAQAIQTISGEKINCPKNIFSSTRDLNYPAFALKVEALTPFASNFSRTVTNVDASGSTYEAKIYPTKSNITVKVIPSTLTFRSVHEKKGFVVSVSGGGMKEGSVQSVSLLWSDGLHEVRSPIVVYT